MKKFFAVLTMFIMITAVFASCSQDKQPETDMLNDTGISKTYTYFNEKVNTSEYYWEISIGGETLVMATKNGVNYNKSVTSESTEVQIYKDSKIYRVHEAQKAYMIQDDVNNDCFRVESLKSTGINKDTYVSGKNKIGDKEYYYEEFNAENGQDRYYFDGDTLKYIEFIQDGNSSFVEIIKAENQAADELFEIPSDFELIEY